jgi:hypothetical protein
MKRIAVLALGLAFVATGCFHPVGPRDLGSFKVPDGEPRRMLIVRGVRLEGKVVGRYENGVATINGIEWLPARNSGSSFMVQDQFDPSKLSPLAKSMYAKTPLISRFVREGLPLDSAILLYDRRMAAQVHRVADAYRAARPRGREYAARMARLAIDPEIAANDSVGERAPSFTDNGSVHLHYLGFGGFDILASGGGPKTPFETARWMQTRAVDEFRSLSEMLAMDRPVLVIIDRSRRMILIGTDATEGFAEFDSLRAAGTPEHRKTLRIRSITPNTLAEMESAGFFRTPTPTP